MLYGHASFDMHFFSFETLKHNLLAMNRFFNGRGNDHVEYVFRVNLQESARPDGYAVGSGDAGAGV